jgi:hypothetical protein
MNAKRGRPEPISFPFGRLPEPTLLAVGYRIAEEWTAITHDAVPSKESGEPEKKEFLP